MTDDLTRQIQTLRGESKMSESEADRLRLEVEEKLAENDSYKTKSRILALENEGLKSEADRLRVRSEDAESKLETAQAEREVAREEAEASKTDRDLSRMELDGVKRALQQVGDEISFMKQEYEEFFDGGSLTAESKQSLATVPYETGSSFSSEHAQRQRQHFAVERTARLVDFIIVWYNDFYYKKCSLSAIMESDLCSCTYVYCR